MKFLSTPSLRFMPFLVVPKTAVNGFGTKSVYKSSSRVAYKITRKLRMSEILHIFHQSPTSYYQMHTDAQRVESQLLNWTSLDSGFPLPFDVTDHFQCSEFAETCFGNFSSSSVDELSKVTAVVEQSQWSKKRKLELDVVEVDTGKRSAECDSAVIEVEPHKAKRNNGNGDLSRETDKKRDYIHVRARRGEATDSHSIAERARRERIKKKMQILQDLVPGCNKMSNKAEILDEIITYVQCLQTDVQILTMKLAASTTTLDSKMDSSLPKQQQQQKLEEFSEWQ